MPPWLPGGFEAFADEVVPILQSRGLFRTEYTSGALRGHFGLDRPKAGTAIGPRAAVQGGRARALVAHRLPP